MSFVNMIARKYIFKSYFFCSEETPHQTLRHPSVDPVRGNRAWFYFCYRSSLNPLSLIGPTTIQKKLL